MMGQGKPINTKKFAKHLRERAIDVTNRKILISQLAGSEQEADLNEPVNCGGFGRVRHFCLDTLPGWPTNSLPIVPACKALGVKPVPRMMRAQVFQNAACAWRCWYYFVPDSLECSPCIVEFPTGFGWPPRLIRGHPAAAGFLRIQARRSTMNRLNR